MFKMFPPCWQKLRTCVRSKKIYGSNSLDLSLETVKDEAKEGVAAAVAAEERAGHSVARLPESAKNSPSGTKPRLRSGRSKPKKQQVLQKNSAMEKTDAARVGEYLWFSFACALFTSKGLTGRTRSGL